MLFKCKELLEASSLPGVPIFSKSRHVITRIVWLVFILIFVGLSIKYIVESVQSFYEYEMVTNINVFRENESQFPVVSFCMNFIDKEININDLNEVLVYCKFDGNQCNTTDFEISQDPSGRVCYRFNSGKNVFNQATLIKNSTRNTMTGGLTVLLNLEKFNTLSNLGYKIYVKISNASTRFIPVQPYYAENVCNLGKGFNSLKIEKEFVQRLPSPYNQCIKQATNQYVSDFFQYFSRNNKTYRQRDCLDLCVWENIKQACNCTETLGEYLECYSSTFNCMNKVLNDYISKNAEIPDHCYADCQQECDFVEYSVYQTYMGSISDTRNLTYDRNKSDEMYLVVVYCPRFEYTHINEIPKMTTFDLVSSIGGILGLFIGVSFFSLVEMLEIFFELLGDSLTSVKTNRNGNKSVTCAELSKELTKLKAEISDQFKNDLKTVNDKLNLLLEIRLKSTQPNLCIAK